MRLTFFLPINYHRVMNLHFSVRKIGPSNSQFESVTTCITYVRFSTKVYQILEYLHFHSYQFDVISVTQM